MPFEILSDVTTTQNQWRFCVNCQGLFWNPEQLPDGTPRPNSGWGGCPGGHFNGAGHVAAGWEFYLPARP
ncbi:hypothetical protein JK361_30205 [Streptomyces sp. 5-8]|uniref:Uncharacterized protein n=1 Tax=Streptomyces musisoli TaxID=2802280 RepID=A0ABS1P906_9ACTN|nr:MULTISPECIES: hypothetical protein [Streptomyces]MBL1108808.1 hypothetical protein [Streptomyces musisoli]MBY8842936.1 hypothetical protein [Streptomyces sp. SP2-10]